MQLITELAFLELTPSTFEQQEGQSSKLNACENYDFRIATHSFVLF